jgi:hypothetical protein
VAGSLTQGVPIAVVTRSRALASVANNNGCCDWRDAFCNAGELPLSFNCDWVAPPSVFIGNLFMSDAAENNIGATVAGGGWRFTVYNRSGAAISPTCYVQCLQIGTIALP